MADDDLPQAAPPTQPEIVYEAPGGPRPPLRRGARLLLRVLLPAALAWWLLDYGLEQLLPQSSLVGLIAIWLALLVGLVAGADLFGRTMPRGLVGGIAVWLLVGLLGFAIYMVSPLDEVTGAKPHVVRLPSIKTDGDYVVVGDIGLKRTRRGDVDQVSVDIREGRAFLDMTIRNKAGRIVAVVRDSELEMFDPAYDANFDDDGVEIVDDQQRPVLQLYRNYAWTPPKTYLQYVSMYPIGCVEIRVQCLYGDYAIDEPFVDAVRDDMPVLFKYPSRDHLGERTAEHIPDGLCPKPPGDSLLNLKRCPRAAS